MITIIISKIQYYIKHDLKTMLEKFSVISCHRKDSITIGTILKYLETEFNLKKENNVKQFHGTLYSLPTEKCSESLLLYS